MYTNDFGKHAGHQPGLGRGSTPSRRGVFPRASFKDKRSRNAGFPSADEHGEHECENMKNMNVRSQSVITNLGFSCYKFENMDLGTHS